MVGGVGGPRAQPGPTDPSLAAARRKFSDENFRHENFGLYACEFLKFLKIFKIENFLLFCPYGAKTKKLFSSLLTFLFSTFFLHFLPGSEFSF